MINSANPSGEPGEAQRETRAKLRSVERRFRVMKDFLSLRPMFHWTEARVRGHVALCVLAATVEAVMAQDLVKAKLTDPDLPFQSMTPRRALSVRC